MIRFREVTKRYPGQEEAAVQDLSLEVDAGELLVLLGESGCGKTTSLKMINRLIDVTEGKLEVDGRRVSDVDPVELRRGIGYVFQGIGLFPHMTVGENVGVVPKLLGWPEPEIGDRVDELLELVHLTSGDFRDRMPQHLSGGQKQRVGLARALAARPRLMLMDEPFGALDPLTRDDLQDEYQKIHRELELTTVMVTHDMTEALLMADRIAVMKEGRLQQVGTPHELLVEKDNEYVAELMGTPRRQTERLEELLEETQGT